MNILSLISFANAIFLIFIAMYSLLISSKVRMNQASFLECSFLAIWSFAYTFFYVATDKESAWFWFRVGSIGWSGFMGALVWFFMALTRYKIRIPKYLEVLVLWILPTFFIVINVFSPWSAAAVELVKSRSGWGWTYVNQLKNPFYWIYMSYLFLGIGACIYILMGWVKNTKADHFRKIALVFLTIDGMLILFGFLSDLVIPLITDLIPPMTNVVLIVFSFSYWIIIFKLDVFKKTSVEASEFVIETISDALIILDEKGKIIQCNKATTEMLGYDREAILGNKLITFFREEDDKEESIQKLYAEKELKNQEALLVKADGSEICTLYSAAIAEDSIHGFMGIIASFHDITKQKTLEKELFRLAHYDTLTDLPNRRYFMKILETYEEMFQQGGKDFAIYFMDLNGFKKINDQMGHDKGDLLLQEVGRRIQACCLDSDLVARIGGDEFVMLHGNITEQKQVEEKVALIRQKFAGSVYVDELVFPVGIAIGGARYSEQRGISAMLRKADQEMYKEKKER
ncbi:MAG: diguanylate cyclase [Vallitaleaceae bacterium]|nr:diguanylate cyclase [Vallitaleaceae bacterium]